MLKMIKYKTGSRKQWSDTNFLWLPGTERKLQEQLPEANTNKANAACDIRRRNGIFLLMRVSSEQILLKLFDL